MNVLFSRFKDIGLPWGSSLALAIIASFGLAFMEWLFFITSPSFQGSSLGGLSVKETTVMLATATALISLLGVLWTVASWTTHFVLKSPLAVQISAYLACIFPGLAITITLSLMADNFTQTVWGWGITSTQGPWRLAYTIPIFLIAILIISRCHQWILGGGNSSVREMWAPIVATLVIAISTVSIFAVNIATGSANSAYPNQKISNEAPNSTMPNIILLGSDGLNASHMSVYGYSRETTPHISSLTKSSLFAQNNFPNAATSLGSVTSILTGKHPTYTRVLYPPDILVGGDAFQHLPGILKARGYRTAEISMPYYVDANYANFRDAFETVNGRSANRDVVASIGRWLGGDHSAYFVSRLRNRLSTRVLHLIFLQSAGNPYEEVTGDSLPRFSDRERMNSLFDLIEASTRPIFAHVHMMGTHGPKFHPREHFYSRPNRQTDTFMTDYYDDAILDFDKYVGELIRYLKDQDLWDQTILVIYTDHGMKYVTDMRTPLIFRFPDPYYSTQIRSNTNNIDIAPTILDYLQIQAPEWMAGRSLLQGEPPPMRPIFSASPTFGQFKREDGLWAVDIESVQEPFYQFGMVRVIVCSQTVSVDLSSIDWHRNKIEGHTAPCANANLPTSDEMIDTLLEHLSSAGFDVDLLSESLE